MFKGFEYNKDYRSIKGRGKYEEEIGLLHDFCASEHENIRLEYDDLRSARRAYGALHNYISKNRKPLKLMQREHYVFAVKTIKD